MKPNFISEINWSELRNQKISLLAVIDYYRINHVPFICEDLEGILNLIDTIQDYAVDEMGVDEKRVFGDSDDEDKE